MHGGGQHGRSPPAGKRLTAVSTKENMQILSKKPFLFIRVIHSVRDRSAVIFNSHVKSTTCHVCWFFYIFLQTLERNVHRSKHRKCHFTNTFIDVRKYIKQAPWPRVDFVRLQYGSKLISISKNNFCWIYTFFRRRTRLIFTVSENSRTPAGSHCQRLSYVKLRPDSLSVNRWRTGPYEPAENFTVWSSVEIRIKTFWLIIPCSVNPKYANLVFEIRSGMVLDLG